MVNLNTTNGIGAEVDVTYIDPDTGFEREISRTFFGDNGFVPVPNLEVTYSIKITMDETGTITNHTLVFPEIPLCNTNTFIATFNPACQSEGMLFLDLGLSPPFTIRIRDLNENKIVLEESVSEGEFTTPIPNTTHVYGVEVEDGAGKKSLDIIDINALPCPTTQQTFTWDGGVKRFDKEGGGVFFKDITTDNNWNNPFNWFNEAVPGSDDKNHFVFIHTEFSHPFLTHDPNGNVLYKQNRDVAVNNTALELNQITLEPETSITFNAFFTAQNIVLRENTNCTIAANADLQIAKNIESSTTNTINNAGKIITDNINLSGNFANTGTIFIREDLTQTSESNPVTFTNSGLFTHTLVAENIFELEEVRNNNTPIPLPSELEGIINTKKVINQGNGEIRGFQIGGIIDNAGIIGICFLNIEGLNSINQATGNIEKASFFMRGNKEFVNEGMMNLEDERNRIFHILSTSTNDTPRFINRGKIIITSNGRDLVIGKSAMELAFQQGGFFHNEIAGEVEIHSSNSTGADRDTDFGLRIFGKGQFKNDGKIKILKGWQFAALEVKDNTTFDNFGTIDISYLGVEERLPFFPLSVLPNHAINIKCKTFNNRNGGTINIGDATNDIVGANKSGIRMFGNEVNFTNEQGATINIFKAAQNEGAFTGIELSSNTTFLNEGLIDISEVGNGISFFEDEFVTEVTNRGKITIDHKIELPSMRLEGDFKNDGGEVILDLFDNTKEGIHTTGTFTNTGGGFVNNEGCTTIETGKTVENISSIFNTGCNNGTPNMGGGKFNNRTGAIINDFNGNYLFDAALDFLFEGSALGLQPIRVEKGGTKSPVFFGEASNNFKVRDNVIKEDGTEEPLATFDAPNNSVTEASNKVSGDYLGKIALEDNEGNFIRNLNIKLKILEASNTLSCQLDKVNNAFCSNTNDGDIQVSVSGGSDEYHFNWEGPNNFSSNAQNINGLAPGIYNLTVTDQADATLKCELQAEVKAGAQEINLNLTDNPLANGIYQAQEKLETTGEVNINAGSEVMFKAGESITLNEGFHAIAGSDFTALIEACAAALVESNPVGSRQLAVGDEQENNNDFTSHDQPALKAYPNPTRQLTTIELDLPKATPVQLDLYDLNGRKIANITNDAAMQAGRYQYEWQCENVPNGLYLLVLNGQAVNRLMVAK